MSSRRLPVGPLQWLVFLHSDFVDTNNIKTARALFSLLLLGQFNGADVFGVHGVCKRDRVPQFIRRANIGFRFGQQTATANQARLYFDVIASLVKRGFTLYDLLPSPLDEVEETWIEPFADQSADVIVEGKDHVCWELARKNKAGDMNTLSRSQRHAFLILWLFWVLSNHECFTDELDTDLLRLNHQITDLSEFVELAK